MKKKLKIIAMLTLGALMAFSVAVFSACGEETTPVHEHALYDVEEVPATCVSEGNIAYKHCIYCGKIFLGDKEVTEKDIILPVDPKNHAEPVSHPEVPATCVVDGVKAYTECTACNVMTDSEGNPVTAEDLAIKASGEHSFGSGITCANCDAYKAEYIAGRSVVVDGLSDIGVVPSSVGASYSANNKETHLAATIKEKMTIGTQTGNKMSASYANDAITLTYTGGSNGQCSFTRLCVGDDGADYVGRFLFSFDISVAADAVVDRIGAKVVDNTATVIDGASYSKLLGARADEENNTERKLTPNETYRFVYLMETTAADQLVQVFVGSSDATWTVSGFHVVLLPDEVKSGVATSTMLYFGDTDMSGEFTPASEPEPAPEPEPEPEESKSYPLPDGTDFFKAASWRVSDSTDTTSRTPSEIIGENGNLEFTSSSASRINLFYVTKTQTSDGEVWRHPGDKKENTDPVSGSIYGIEYSYNMTVNASGGFSMLLLGAKTCCSMTEHDALGLFVEFKTDGAVTLYHSGGNNTTYESWGEFTGTSGFKPNEDVQISFRLTRTDGDTIVIGVFVNGTKVEFSGTDADGIFSAEAGAFKSSGVLTNTGMGQRFGVYPDSGSTVTISSCEVTNNKAD